MNVGTRFHQYLHQRYQYSYATCMHSDAQFAGSSSVPAHVEMMSFPGIGNNPMVGCTVACAVDVAQALNK